MTSPNRPEQAPRFTYYTSEPKLRMRGYGRGIQQMVDRLKRELDPERRQQMAEAAITAMSIVNPHAKDQQDYKAKLWDHLFELAGYDLEVVAPHEIRPREERIKPVPIPYYPLEAQMKQYGQNIQKLIDKAIAEEDDELYDALVERIANMMKQFLRDYETGAGSDHTIVQHLRQLSDGEIDLDPQEANIQLLTNAPMPKNDPRSRKKRSKKRKSRSSGGGNYANEGGGSSNRRNRGRRNKNRRGGGGSSGGGN